MDTTVFDKKVKERNKAQGKKNFVAGMAFEFVVLKKERKKAIWANRSAGSHTLIDIAAIRVKGVKGCQESETRLISCKKNGTWLDEELNELIDLEKVLPEGQRIYLAYYDKTLARRYIIERLSEV